MYMEMTVGSLDNALAVASEWLSEEPSVKASPVRVEITKTQGEFHVYSYALEVEPEPALS